MLLGLDRFLDLVFFVLAYIIDPIHLPSQNLHHHLHDEQEPVDVHEQQCKQQSVEEKVERDIGDGLQAGDVRGVQHFEGEPVQSEAEPCDAKAQKAHAGQDIIDHVAFSCTDLEVDVEFCELQQNVVDVMEEQHEEPDIVIPEGVGECNQCQSDEVMQQHDGGVFPPRIHVYCGVDGVAVEAPLDQIDNGDIRRHLHSALPVVKDRGRVVKEAVVAIEEQVGGVGP